ncbi:MAG: tRNA (N6-isopentenyl adenosine(37)-C2)-methylthiotransferase MiaB [Firmicutes bacterium]|nr:tRNA (N6-isopentenyl adenosine(37)-C2)-methylthiotransferase MiaB [Bacillota bacterium]
MTIKPRTYFVRTYGCQMNERDSETIAGIFSARGMKPADSMDTADIVMVNTCTVRDKAEQKVFGLLGKLRELKEKRPDMLLGICGCMPQQQQVAKRIRSRFPFMDIIIGTHNLQQLDTYLEQVLMERKQILEVWEERQQQELYAPARRSAGLKAFVNINWGCNNFCTYCIVPFVRGREKSRSQADIIAEIEGLVNEGYREVTLLGQNVNSYGKDLPDKPDFAELLAAVNQIGGLWRIRFMTSHPRDVSARLIDAIAGLDKVCKHLHLPIQAGSDRILAEMNRGYTQEHYLLLVEQIRAKVPDIALTTDIIVGFPGETEADFAETMAVLRQVEFDSAFTFMYSPRKGTPAAGMEAQVETAVKRERLQKLIALQNEISLKRNRALIGQTVNVLFEDKTEAMFKGRTEGNKLVFAASANNLLGKQAQVTITEAKTWNLVGQVMDGND